MTTAVRERPIIMAAESVRAIFAGRKTQTRRPVKKPLRDGVHSPKMRSPQFYDRGRRPIWTWLVGEGPYAYAVGDRYCPYGQPGDRLWVRETWAEGPSGPIYKADFDTSDGFGSVVINMRTGETCPLRWRSPIHMRRKHSRLTLEITDVRVERVQDISEADAWAEGVERIDKEPRIAFANAWDALNAKRGYGWDVNPWVRAISFRVLNR